MWTFVKIVAVVLIVYFIFVIVKATRVVKKEQDALLDAYSKKQELYHHIDEKLFDETPDDELKDALLAHIFAKEDENFETLQKRLTKAETVLYTIYQMDSAVDQGRGSVRKFFDGPSRAYAAELLPAYQAVGSEKLVALMGKIKAMLIAEQNGKLDDVLMDSDEDYGTYTVDYMDLKESENFEAKLVTYLRNNKNDFLN